MSVRSLPSVCAVLMLLAGASGCHHAVYKPGTLPPELSVYPMPDITALDLSRAARGYVAHHGIYHGDVLRVTVNAGLGEENMSDWELRVDPNGSVNLPLIGPVRVVGMNVSDAESALTRAYIQGQVFKQPAVTVEIGQRYANRVQIAGAVEQPGPVDLPVASSDLISAIAAAGGLSNAATGTVRIQTPSPPGSPNAPGQPNVPQPNVPAEQVVNIYELAAGGQGNVYLRDGSHVMIEQRPQRQIYMMGLTANKMLTLPPNMNVRVLDALAQSGGPRFSPWIADEVKVIRKMPGSNDTATIKVSLKEARKNGQHNIFLADGDIVSVEENAVTFTLGTLQQMVGIGATGLQAALLVP